MFLFQQCAPATTHWFICHDGLDAIEVKGMHERRLAEFRMVGEQDGPVGLRCHAFLEDTFVLVGFHDAAFFAETLAADESEIDVIVSERFLGNMADQRARVFSQRPACGDETVRRGKIVVQDTGRVGNDGEILLLLQTGQQGEACRAGVDHEAITVVHERSGLAGDDLFVLAHDGVALEEGDVFPRVLA